ncbi:DNA integrity scanning protein DisA nucleotide-binding domain protein [Nonomuraea sp. NPDC049141]|uniref:DNA integrity scanning protein DisA nucleotide-binding domain protein n=1 Tax=Nonomuraea sp. NPDC049141 TaxID=3155500 RepID=UPI0033CC6720
MITPKRIARIRDELIDEIGLELPSIVLEEVVYARYIPIHELKQPQYGAMIIPDNDFLPLFSTFEFGPFETRDIQQSSLDVIRLLADGNTMFAGKDGLGSYLLEHSATEKNLAEIVSNFHAVVVQRTTNPTEVKIYHRDGISTWSGAAWHTRPYSHDYSGILMHAVDGLEDTSQFAIAEAILDFCMHTLSAAKIGATIVWDRAEFEADFRQYTVDEVRNVDRSQAINLPPLPICDYGNHPGIANLLEQFDLAMLIDSNGILQSARVGLVSGISSRSVSTTGGMRHNSAIRFSNEEQNALVFVVSQDGPVTVFRAGEVVISPAHASYYVIEMVRCICCEKIGSWQEDNSYAPDPDCFFCRGTGLDSDEGYLLDMTHSEYVEKRRAWDNLFPSRTDPPHLCFIWRGGESPQIISSRNALPSMAS